jgi:hypothetical protein
MKNIFAQAQRKFKPERPFWGAREKGRLLTWDISPSITPSISSFLYPLPACAGNQPQTNPTGKE